MKKGKHTLGERDFVVCAYATWEGGPGWANSPIWYIVRDGNGVLREECLQPDEQSVEMRAIFRYSAMTAEDMRKAVILHLRRSGGGGR